MVQVGKEGDSMWDTGSRGELQHSRSCAQAWPGEAQEATEPAGKNLLL